MRRLLFYVLAIVGFGLSLYSCQKAPVLEFTGSTAVSFTRDGGSQRITFTTNRDWSVSSSQSWCKASPSAGSASDTPITVTLSCEANNTYDDRSATITIMADELVQTIQVSQETGLGLLVSPQTVVLSNAAQSFEIEVQKNVPYSVSIDGAGKEWLEYKGTKSLSSEKATFSVEANTSYSDRECTILFQQTDGSLSQVVKVTQRQTDGLFVTTPEYNLSDEGHTLSVEVMANVTFDVTPEADWIHYVETKALKSSTITLTVDANDTYDARSGKVTVKQTNGSLTGEIIVNQAVNYGLLVSPEVISITKDAQVVQVEVKYNVEYDFVIPEAAKDWISVQTEADTKGLATDMLYFAIAENKTYSDRETAIAFKQVDGDLTGTVKIVQAQTDYLSISPKKDSISYKEGTVSLSVITNIDYSISTVQGEEWVTVGEGTAAGTAAGLTTFIHEVSFPENVVTQARYAVLSVAGAAGDPLEYTLAQGPQPIVEFKDATFKAYCVENYDADGDGEISALEALSITKIDVYGKDIASLQGIEYMTNLTVLDFGKNRVSSLDVSHNPALTKIGCYSNELTSIDVTANPALTELSFGNNIVSSLDLSHNPALTKLEFYNNAVKELDLSHNPALTDLSCGKNQLTVLDVSYCKEMKVLQCAENSLLTEIWLAEGQTIENFSYDTERATIKYK